MDTRYKLLFAIPLLMVATAMVGPDGGNLTTSRWGAVALVLGVCLVIALGLIVILLIRMKRDAEAEYLGGPEMDAGLIDDWRDSRLEERCKRWARYALRRDPAEMEILAFRAGYAQGKSDFQN